MLSLCHKDGGQKHFWACVCLSSKILAKRKSCFEIVLIEEVGQLLSQHLGDGGRRISMSLRPPFMQLPEKGGKLGCKMGLSSILEGFQLSAVPKSPLTRTHIHMGSSVCKAAAPRLREDPGAQYI